MKRYALLYLLTFAGIPCWMGVAGFMFIWLNPFGFVMDGSRISEYFRLACYVVIMLLPYVAVAVFSIRSFEILKGEGYGVCRGNKKTIAFAITGVLFWGFWTRCALAFNEFAFASWRDLWRSHEPYEYVFQSACIVLAFVTPMVTTAYFAVLFYHRISDLRKRRKVADRT